MPTHAQRTPDQQPQSKSALEVFGRDLTALAKDDKLDPVIGRDSEIRRTIQILSRRTKNNPILIGEPGVGKTAIVEGLALRIATGDVPSGLKNRRLISLDLAGMVAGSSLRGEFEQRLKVLLEEITESNGEIITFIDELHMLVGAGGAEGALDAGNMLKPALARGDLHLIGATTLDEYRSRVETDAALERRFQPVLVGEPSVDDTIAILRGLRERYEVHHGVRIQDTALVAAAELSDRYVSDRYLPDKAIDLVDEAASMLKMEVDSLPTEVDEVDRKVRQLKLERVALAEEKDSASKERLAVLDDELKELTEELTEMRSHWESEKEAISNLRGLKRTVTELQSAAEAHQRTGNLSKAAEIIYGKLPKAEAEVADATKTLAELQIDRRMLKEEVDDSDIAEVVAQSTGIPVARLLKTESERLLKLEDEIHQRVIAQDEAVSEVADAVRRSRAGLSEASRPIGSFLFLGPTGVGKTELARALAAALFDDERSMIRIDMSEYLDKHSVSRLIGAPPGYVGYEEGGQLTEKVRRRPYSVILLDEVEKSHPEVFGVLLQLLDDGRLTDGKGRTVDFSNVIVIMSSNLQGEIEDFFRPELINRIDAIVRFDELKREDLLQIGELQIAQLNERLAKRNLALEITPEALEALVDEGYSPEFGARPLRRVIRRRLEDVIARGILSGDLHSGLLLKAALSNGKVQVQPEGDLDSLRQAA